MLDVILKLIETVTVKVREINIGSNKKVEIETLDQSKNFNLYYRAEIGLSPKEIINLSDEDVGKLVRQQAYLQLKAANKDYPDEISRLEALYTASAITTGTLALSAVSLNTQNELLSSADFIKQLPLTINNITIQADSKHIQAQLPIPKIITSCE